MRLELERDRAEREAINALARYKFQMFGYWAALWVTLNRLCDKQRPSPFRKLVHQARMINLGRVAGAASPCTSGRSEGPT